MNVTIYTDGAARGNPGPGVSLTIEICCPARALNKVDLPTFGLPIIATIGLLIYLTSSQNFIYQVLSV